MANDGGQTLPRIARAEHIGPDDTGDNIQAKRTANYVWDGADWQRMTQPGGSASSGKTTDAYGIQAISDDGTYKYFFFENDDTNYYVMRKNLTTKVFSYTKGTGSYTTVYQSEILGPSGSPTWGTRGATF
jgi:hypothetical protein